MVSSRIDILSLPPRMRDLPIDEERGFVIPWFVYIDEHGKADFRVIGENKMHLALSQRLCWICGQKLGAYLAFAIGPMCAINRINSEPPSHQDCAAYAARACPFLTRPHMHRRTNDLPEEMVPPTGVHFDRNPGAVCLWVTKRYTPFQEGRGVLFDLGEPIEIHWFTQGRHATREEIEAALESGVAILRQVAEAEGSEAIRQLTQAVSRTQELLPDA